MSAPVLDETTVASHIRCSCCHHSLEQPVSFPVPLLPHLRPDGKVCGTYQIDDFLYKNGIRQLNSQSSGNHCHESEDGSRAEEKSKTESGGSWSAQPSATAKRKVRQDKSSSGDNEPKLKKNKPAESKPSAFERFFAERVAETKLQHPTLLGPELMRHIGVQWRDMSDEDRMTHEYPKQKKNTTSSRPTSNEVPEKSVDKKTKTKVKKRDPNAPKSARSAYIFFMRQELPKLKKKSPSLEGTGAVRQIAERWKNLSDKRKAPFEKQAALDKKRYEAERDAYIPPAGYTKDGRKMDPESVDTDKEKTSRADEEKTKPGSKTKDRRGRTTSSMQDRMTGKPTRERSPTRAEMDLSVKRCSDLGLDNSKDTKSIDELTRQFHETGLCHFPRGLTAEQVTRSDGIVTQSFNDHINTINQLGLQEQFLHKGFDTFKLRHTERYDIHIDQFQSSEFEFLRSSASWLPLVKSILGDDCALIHTGVMLSLPGSRTQPLHQDGPHLSYKKHLPAHVVNVFVPLVDLDARIGPTEFFPGTHVEKHYNDDIDSIILCPKAGECVLFDYRVKHRGLSNRSSTPRPVLYFTYGQPHFNDKYNFSKRRYLKMPPLVQRKSRAERVANRQQRRGDT